MLTVNIRSLLNRLVPRGVGHGAGVSPILVHRFNDISAYCFNSLTDVCPSLIFNAISSTSEKNPYKNNKFLIIEILPPLEGGDECF